MFRSFVHALGRHLGAGVTIGIGFFAVLVIILAFQEPTTNPTTAGNQSYGAAGFFRPQEIDASDRAADNFINAAKICHDLGNGWHLPTMEELMLFSGNVSTASYLWTRTPYSGGGQDTLGNPDYPLYRWGYANYPYVFLLQPWGTSSLQTTYDSTSSAARPFRCVR